MKQMKAAAQVQALDTVLDFIRQQLEPYDCPMKTMFQLELVVEELFVNIASYAYAPGTGEVTVCCGVEGEPACVTIRLMDQGQPFDPLARPDAETTPEALQARIGGLGILLVKKTMDEVTYAYENNTNILTLRKIL